jgi:hypothetical protein
VLVLRWARRSVGRMESCAGYLWSLSRHRSSHRAMRLACLFCASLSGLECRNEVRDVSKHRRYRCSVCLRMFGKASLIHRGQGFICRPCRRAIRASEQMDEEAFEAARKSA